MEPPLRTFGEAANGTTPSRLFAFRHIRLGFVQLLDSLDYLRPYQERWGEVEAYGLAQRRPVFQ